MSAMLMPEGKQSFTNSAGAPLVGGKVYTYDAGTNTPRSTYQDAAGTVSNANPVILDARGEATVFWDGAYKIVLKDASDVTIWTVDNVASTNAYVDLLRADLFASSGSSIVRTAQSLAGSIVRTLQDKSNDVISVRDFGILPGAAYASSNCDRYAVLVATVTALGGHVSILWPASPEKYWFSPRTNPNFSASTAYAWRGAVELVNVSYVYHLAAGAEIYVDADPTWYRGNPIPANSSLDEGVIQFRASSVGACHHVGIIGPCAVTTSDTLDDPTNGRADGAAMGVAYRGCQATLTYEVSTEYWGTDGIYYGMAYADAFKGENHILFNPQSNRCHRQGISVAGNDHGRIFGGYLHDTYGGSFGHGIDFEANGPNTQEDWVSYGLRTKDNQRGACNFINSRSIRFHDFDFNEQYAGCSGTIFLEGSNVVGFDAEDILFSDGSVVGTQSVLYGNIYAGVGGAIDNIRFRNCKLSTLSNTPNSSAWLRVNPFGATTNRIGTITFQDCEINGNGGIVMRGDGTNKARLIFEGETKWNLTNPSGSALSFNFSTTGTYVDFSNIELKVDSTKTLVTTSPYMVEGRMQGCRLTSHAAAIIQWVDYGAGRTNFVIGKNDFSTYSYYKGVTSALNLKSPGAVEEFASGDFGVPCRFVHGGRQRVLAYIANPAVFIDRQAPINGDVVRNIGNNTASVAATEYVYDSVTAQWKLSAFITRKGATALRPTVGVADVGQAYMDTTLSANGKPIFFNGTIWVDSTGAAV